MPRSYTRAELRARAQVLADDENGLLATDAQYNEWIDESFGFVWDLLVNSGVFPLIDEYDITISSTGSGNYTGGPAVDRGIEALASDHYSVVRVYEVRSADDLRPLDPLHPQDIHRYTRDGGVTRRYLLWGDALAEKKVIRFYPKPAIGDVFRVIYVPEPGKFTDDADAIPSYSAWMDRFITIDVAMKARIKEESGIRDLQAERNVILDQIDKSKEIRSLEALQRPENEYEYGDEILRDPATRRW
jgi:hypothetical protein